MIINQRIVITGASGGIGQALAHNLARRGNILYLMGRNAEQLEKLALNLPGEHIQIVADLNSPSDRKHAIDSLKEHAGEIDMLINNAGISCFKFFADMKKDDIQNLLMTNLLSPVLLTHELLPFLNSKRAKIVNIGSTFGAIGYPGFSVYGASKFGLRGFSESLSRELSDSHIDVQYIAPRATYTSSNTDKVTEMNQQLGNRMDDPDVVAEWICEAIASNRQVTNFGWPEKAFVYLNASITNVVDCAIKSKLQTIQNFAKEN